MKIQLREITIRQLSEGYADNAEAGVVGYGAKLDIRPPYQREFIYKDKQRDAVIDTVRKDFPLNVMYWAVRDDVAARLTVDTVRRTKAGDSRPQALRKAMLALIDDPRVPGGRDPSVWAPFILVQR